MKIVFFRHSFLSRGGDKMIALHASHLAQSGHEVVIMTNVVKTVFALDKRVKIEPLHLKGVAGTLLSAVINRIDADLIIVDIIPLACLLALRSRKRTIYFAQDYDESYYSNTLQKWFVRCCYYIGLMMFGIPVISVSHPLADILRKRFKAKAEIVENGVDTEIFYHVPDPDLVQMKGERKAVLILSRSDKRKGFDIAREVIKRLSISQQNLFEVWTVGETCSGLFQNTVHHDFGYVNEEKLRSIMSSADFLFYPTRHEGFPLMPLEALACGCPVVATTAVPYGNNEPSIKITRIADVEAMFRILSALIGNEPEFSAFRTASKSIVERHDIAACKRRFEQSLANIYGGC